MDYVSPHNEGGQMPDKEEGIITETKPKKGAIARGFKRVKEPQYFIFHIDFSYSFFLLNHLGYGAEGFAKTHSALISSNILVYTQ